MHSRLQVLAEILFSPNRTLNARALHISRSMQQRRMGRLTCRRRALLLLPSLACPHVPHFRCLTLPPRPILNLQATAPL